MKPNFALDLNQDGIGLLHRAGANWLWLGAVPLNAPGFASRLQALRREANVFERDGMTTKIVIPNSEILYAELHAPGPGSAARVAQIREGLRRLTPCDVDDLVFDWRPAGHHAQVAAVARETLQEAEAFAVGHRFNPISLVAVPEPDRFEGEPFFGTTAHAAGLLANGDLVEPDIGAMAVIGRRGRDESDGGIQPSNRGAKAESTNYATEVANEPAPPLDPERESFATTTSAARAADKPERNASGGQDQLGRQDKREPAARRSEPNRDAETDPAQAKENLGERRTGGVSPITAPGIARESSPPGSESPDPGTKSGRMQPAAANAAEGRETPGQISGNRKEKKPGPRILLLETERNARPERGSGPAAKTSEANGPGTRTRVATAQLAFSFFDGPDHADNAPNAPVRNAEKEESARAPTTRPEDAPISRPDHGARPRAPRDLARRGMPAAEKRSPSGSGEDVPSGQVELVPKSPHATGQARQPGKPPANIDGATVPSGGNGRATRRRNKSPAAESPGFVFDPAPANAPGKLDFGEPASVSHRAGAQEKPSEGAASPPVRNRHGARRGLATPETGHPALDFGDTSACKQAKLDLSSPSAARHRSPPSEKPRFDGEGTTDPYVGNGSAAPRRDGAPRKERPAPGRVAGTNGQPGHDFDAKSANRKPSPPSEKIALVADRAERPSVAPDQAPRRPGISAWASVALALMALAALAAMAIGFGNLTPADRTDDAGPTGTLAEPSAESPSELGSPDAEASWTSPATAEFRQTDPEPTPERVGDMPATAPPASSAVPHADENAPPEQDSRNPQPHDAAESLNVQAAPPRIRPDFAAPGPGSVASDDSPGKAAFAAPLPRPTGRFGAVVSRAPVLRPTISAETAIGAASAQAIPNPPAPLPRPDDIGSIAEAAFAASLQSSPSGVTVASAATQRDALDPERINLIGVYGSGNGRRAIVRLQSGRFVTVEPGDRMDGGRVFAIGEGELSYVKEGRSHLLRLPKG